MRALLFSQPKPPQQITPLCFYGQREKIIADVLVLLESHHFNTLYDPFSGSASISFAAIEANLAENYCISDADPSFSELWNELKKDPESLLTVHSSRVHHYLKLSPEERAAYYKEQLALFNSIPPFSEPNKRASLFVFLINFTNKHIPLFDENFKLVTQPREITSVSDEERELNTFCQRCRNLTITLNKTSCKFNSGEFNQHIKTATSKDLIIFDPPYPTQKPDVYYRPKNESDLQLDLRNAFKDLNAQEIPFIVFYGATRVALSNQFSEDEYAVQHLLRFTRSPVHGDGLEHVYVSKRIPLSHEDLPASMGFYRDYFQSNIEMSEEGYQAALNSLREKTAAGISQHPMAKI